MTTDRRTLTMLVPMMLGLVAVASIAQAHGPDGKGVRSILRLQGYNVAPQTSSATVHEMVLVSRGVEHRFWAIDRRRFELASPSDTPRAERDRLTLQGDFELLARFAKLRTDQLVTILGEQRPGSGDLFILTLDVCPP